MWGVTKRYSGGELVEVEAPKCYRTSTSVTPRTDPDATPCMMFGAVAVVRDSGASNGELPNVAVSCPLAKDDVCMFCNHELRRAGDGQIHLYAVLIERKLPDGTRSNWGTWMEHRFATSKERAQNLVLAYAMWNMGEPRDRFRILSVERIDKIGGLEVAFRRTVGGNRR